MLKRKSIWADAGMREINRKRKAESEIRDIDGIMERQTVREKTLKGKCRIDKIQRNTDVGSKPRTSVKIHR